MSHSSEGKLLSALTTNIKGSLQGYLPPEHQQPPFCFSLGVPTVNIPQNSYSSVTGQDVQIPCSVSANPTATISWTFISTSQSQTSITTSTSKYTFNPTSTDGTLRIRSTSSSDTGTYRCQATNAVGTSSDSASLSVSGSKYYSKIFLIR